MRAANGPGQELATDTKGRTFSGNGAAPPGAGRAADGFAAICPVERPRPPPGIGTRPPAGSQADARLLHTSRDESDRAETSRGSASRVGGISRFRGTGRAR